MTAAVSPRVLAAKKTIDAAWVSGTNYDLSSQAAFAMDDAALIVPVPSPLSVAWAAQCRRARETAARLRRDNASTEAFEDAAPCYDQVSIVVTPRSLEGWLWWLNALDISPRSVQSTGVVCVAYGLRDGVPVRLVGHGVPALLKAHRAQKAGA